ncbi:globin domain-containing protein [Thioclava sp. GXIMD4216]|uniref:Globin domain-containing protein n=1 Tax=Thioclava litoralis TaxID=3076557 RepID=A0ABZ1DW66_9RHOB|nr:globin domain-containing protein [Thioclava sp. FTW29]
MLDKGLTALIRDSYAKALLRRPCLLQDFYLYLLTRHPEMEPLFPRSIARQADKFAGALQLLLSYENAPEDLSRALRQLGRDHRGHGVRAEHYPAVIEALVATLAIQLGRDWTEAYETAWRRFLEFVSREMLAGASDEAA